MTIQGFAIQKTDKTTQAIVQIAASNTSILNNAFSGQFVIGEGDVARAMVIQGGLTGLKIENNTFADLRQPAYISGVTTGTVTGNYTARTKGWVIEQGNLTFSNNTWGQGADANVYDIAILGTSGSTYYTDLPALSQSNNTAFIEDQRSSPVTLSVVYVDESVTVSGDGTQRSPKKTLTEAISRVVTGGTIVLASNITTTAQTDITKALSLDGAGYTLTAAFSGGSVIQITANNVTIKNLIEDGGTQSTVPTTANRGINIYKVTGVTLDGVTARNNSKNGIVVNGSTVTANNVSASGNGWEAIDVDLGGGVATPAVLTVTGVSQHSGSKAAIRIDDVTKSVSVVDTNSQYGITAIGNIRDYYFQARKETVATATQTSNSTGPVTVTVEMPAGTVVTGSVTWNGVINPPTETSTTIDVVGFTTTVLSAITVGSNSSDLTFDKAVKLTFVGQAGQRVGWYNHAKTFAEITTSCTDNTQLTNNGLATGTDCKMDVGNDLVVWTKHFSTFTTYKLSQNINVGGSASPITSSTTVTPSATTNTTTTTNSTPVQGSVLGAAAYNFIVNLTVGSRGEDVTALQEQLTAEGVYSGPITGYFGPLTRAGVKAYQGKHGISNTGFVGPLTLAALTAGVTPTRSDEARTMIQTKIVELLKQLVDLQQKLNIELGK